MPNLSGLWLGSFSYPQGLGPTTPFLARIEDHAGSLDGSIIEPNTVGSSSEQLQAVISGSRERDAVDFTKMYDGESDAAHAVDYVGRLSADGMWYRCLYATSGTDLRTPLRAGVSRDDLLKLITTEWSARADRGAEERLAVRHRAPLVSASSLKKDPHLEMHTRGG